MQNVAKIFLLQLELVTREKNNLLHRVEHLEVQATGYFSNYSHFFNVQKKTEEQAHGGKRYQMLLEEVLDSWYFHIFVFIFGA